MSTQNEKRLLSVEMDANKEWLGDPGFLEGSRLGDSWERIRNNTIRQIMEVKETWLGCNRTED